MKWVGKKGEATTSKGVKKNQRDVSSLNAMDQPWFIQYIDKTTNKLMATLLVRTLFIFPFSNQVCGSQRAMFVDELRVPSSLKSLFGSSLARAKFACVWWEQTTVQSTGTSFGDSRHYVWHR